MEATAYFVTVICFIQRMSEKVVLNMWT